MIHPFLQSLAGGLLIGLASWLLLASLGRVAGITGIACNALLPSGASDTEEDTGQGSRDGRFWALAFMVGLALAGALATAWLKVPATPSRPWSLLIPAGLLVGFGTVLGSGCTSGHGVCGLGRRSMRSLVATLVFMATGFATVFIAKFL